MSGIGVGSLESPQVNLVVVRGLTNQVATEPLIEVEGLPRLPWPIDEIFRRLDAIEKRLDRLENGSSDRLKDRFLGSRILIEQCDKTTLSVRARKTLYRLGQQHEVQFLDELTYDRCCKMQNCGPTTAAEIIGWKEVQIKLLKGKQEIV